MNEREFQLLSELVAEAWLHASRRWRETRGSPFVVGSESATPHSVAAMTVDATVRA
jgi:hypothetical protein